MIGMNGLFFASREEWNEFADATGMLGWIISPLEGTLLGSDAHSVLIATEEQQRRIWDGESFVEVLYPEITGSGR